jgi:hypothetical protein
MSTRILIPRVLACAVAAYFCSVFALDLLGMTTPLVDAFSFPGIISLLYGSFLFAPLGFDGVMRIYWSVNPLCMLLALLYTSITWGISHLLCKLRWA